MKKHYLDFEKPLKDFDDEIRNLVSIDSESEKLDQLKNMRIEKEKEIFSNLNPWQTVQLARHPNRPYTLDYISAWCDDFIELHGDKAFSDDKAVVAGIGTIDTHRVVIIGQQKGRNTKENLHRNFGMMKPEGYRKALRVLILLVLILELQQKKEDKDMLLQTILLKWHQSKLQYYQLLLEKEQAVVP